MFTYEIYVFERGRWILESSYTADRRDEALNFARRIENNKSAEGVQVIRGVSTKAPGESSGQRCTTLGGVVKPRHGGPPAVTPLDPMPTFWQQSPAKRSSCRSRFIPTRSPHLKLFLRPVGSSRSLLRSRLLALALRHLSPPCTAAPRRARLGCKHHDPARFRRHAASP